MNLLNSRNLLLAYALAVIVIVLDQLTKNMVSASFSYAQVEPITSFFNLTLRHNYGVAFSIFDDAEGSQRWFLAALAFFVSIGIVVWMYRLPKMLTAELIGLSLVLGGAIGNLYDRVVLGYVVDFVELYYQPLSFYWPAFNVADSAICIGAGLLIYDSIFNKKKCDDSANDNDDAK